VLDSEIAQVRRYRKTEWACTHDEYVSSWHSLFLLRGSPDY
jgi:hypothetical protein